MKYAIQVVVFMFLCLGNSQLANAQVGDLKDVVDAAKKNQKPAYIAELMEQLNTKLKRFFDNQSQKDPRAALLAMYAVVAVIENAIVDGTHSARCSACIPDLQIEYSDLSAPWSDAQKAAMKALQPWDAIRYEVWWATFGAFWSRAQNVAYVAAWDNAWNAAQPYSADKLSGNQMEKIRRVAYRAAEWAVLNWLLDEIHNIMNKAYETALVKLNGNPYHTSFPESGNLITFLAQHFEPLKYDALMVLAPWLMHIVPTKLVSAFKVSSWIVAFRNAAASWKTPNVDKVAPKNFFFDSF